MHRTSLINITIIAAVTTTSACSTDNSATSHGNAVTPAVVSTSADARDFLTAFNAGDAGAVAQHFAADGTWTLTNGVTLFGQEAIEAFFKKGVEGGAGNLTLGPTVATQAGDATVLRGSFAFDLKPGVQIVGQRITFTRNQASTAQIVADVWMPADASGDKAEIVETLARRADAVNSGDARGLMDQYAHPALVALSNGKTFTGEAVPAFLQETAAAGITDMSFGAPSVTRASDVAVYSVTPFRLTVKTPDKDIPVAGEQLTVWVRDGAQWRAAVELAWPT